MPNLYKQQSAKNKVLHFSEKFYNFVKHTCGKCKLIS